MNNPIPQRPMGAVRQLGATILRPRHDEPSAIRIPEKMTYFSPPLVNDDNWNEMVLQCEKPVAVVFTMVGCSACTSLKKTSIQVLKNHYRDSLEILEFQCSPQTVMDKELDATGHPSIIFFNKGVEVGVYLGYSQAEYYINYIRTNKAIGLNR